MGFFTTDPRILVGESYALGGAQSARTVQLAGWLEREGLWRVRRTADVGRCRRMSWILEIFSIYVATSVVRLREFGDIRRRMSGMSADVVRKRDIRHRGSMCGARRE
jgi:hypothetical protein